MQFPRLALLCAVVVSAACGGSDDEDGGTSPSVATLASISVTSPAIALSAGQRQAITPSAVGSDGKAMTGVTFTYSSGTPNVAFVAADGTVLGLSAGTSAITVTGTKAGVSRTATVNVTVGGALAASASVVADANQSVFTPNLVAVARGGSVSWTFPGQAHNVTFAATTGAPANIGNTQNSTTPVARSFTTSGTFNYNCTLHAGMTGTVVVP